MRCLLRIPSLLIHDALVVRDIRILDAAGDVPTVPPSTYDRVAHNDYGYVCAEDLTHWSHTHQQDTCMHADALRTWLADALRALTPTVTPTGHTPGTQRAA